MLIRKDVYKLIVPVFTEQLFITSIGILNTIIASGMGKEALSAIGTVDSFNSIIIFFFNSLAVGATVVVAQYVGQKNADGVKEAAIQSVFSSVAISALLTLIIWIFRDAILLMFIGKAEPKVIENSIVYFDITLFNYPLTAFSFVASGILRSSGNQDKPMKINIFINAANIILSYLFIYGISLRNAHVNLSIPGMGVKGAAIGITLSRLIGAALFLYVMVGKTGLLSFHAIKTFRLNLQQQKMIFNIGLPAGIETFVFNIGKFVQQIFIISLGTASLAVNTISWSILGLLIIPGSAFSIVATTLAGNYVGQEDYQEVRRINTYIIKLATICKAALSLIVFPLATIIASVYSSDAGVIGLTADIIRMNAIAIPILWPAGFITPSSLRGTGDTKYTMIVSIASLWVFRVLVGYIFSIVLHFGIVGLWAAMYFDWITRGVAYYLRMKGEKWQRRMIA